MKINTKLILKNMKGVDLTISKEDTNPFTLGISIANILNVVRDSRSGHTPHKMDSIKRHVLSLKFYNDKEVELDEADLSSLLETVKTDPYFDANIIGQTYLLIKK